MLTRMGCRTLTRRDATTPVTTGEQGASHLRKDEYKGQCGGVELVGEELRAQRDAMPVAKSGSVKKPMKLMATEAAMMFGTLEVRSVSHRRFAGTGS
jgi:hypothetical protein